MFEISNREVQFGLFINWYIDIIVRARFSFINTPYNKSV